MEDPTCGVELKPLRHYLAPRWWPAAWCWTKAATRASCPVVSCVARSPLRIEPRRKGGPRVELTQGQTTRLAVSLAP